MQVQVWAKYQGRSWKLPLVNVRLATGPDSQFSMTALKELEQEIMSEVRQPCVDLEEEGRSAGLAEGVPASEPAGAPDERPIT